MLLIVGQGGCPMCGAPLQIAGQVDVSEPEVTSSSNDDNQTGSTRTRPIHSGTKSVMIKTNLVASDLCNRDGKVSAHISQLLPVRAAVDVLAQAIRQSNSVMVSMEVFKEPSETLAGIRYELIELENRYQITKRGYRASAGFPFHYEEDMPQMWAKSKGRGKPKEKKSVDVRQSFAKKSWSRFRNTVFGGIRKADGSVFGALYELGLAHIESRGQELFIGLTSAGAELANLNNPLLHVEDFETVSEQDLVTRFSEEEREWFWKHVNKHIVVEKESLRQVLAMTQNEEVHVKELTEQLVKYVKEVRDLKATGTPPARRALHLFFGQSMDWARVPVSPASGHYRSTELGIESLKENRKTNSYSWTKGKK